MSQFKEITVGGTVYFWFAANTTAGSAGDGSTPLYDVRLAGAASTAAPTASGTPTLLTHANYADGEYEIGIDTTGYSVGSEYAVFCALTISAATPTGFVGSFVVRAAASTLYQLVAAILEDTDVIGAPAGASIAADLVVIDNFVDGIESTIGAAGAGLTAVALAATGLDAVPYTATGAVALAKATWTDTLTTYTDGMAGKRLRGISAIPTINGTINDAAATTTSFITTLTGYGTNFFVDAMCLIEYAADKWQANAVTTYNTATGAMTFAEAFYAAPANGLTIAMYMTHIHPISQIQSGLATQASVDDLPTNAELATALGTADDATLAAIAALNNLSQANIRTALGMASANMDTQLDALPTNTDLATALGTADDAVLAQVAFVKAKTDLIPAAPAAVGDQVTLTSAYDFAKGTVAMAESYPVLGATITPAQALYNINQQLGEHGIVSTTMTIKKRDRVTAAKTFTLDSAATPTSITEAT